MAEVRLHSDGRLAALLCQGQPLRLSICRHGVVTGLVLTYHASGAVAEVLAFRDGWLDGVTEVYDATGHLLERTLYRGGHPVPLSQIPLAKAPTDPPLPLPPSVGSSSGSSTSATDPEPTAPPTTPADPAPVAPATSEPATVPRSRPPIDTQPILGLGLRGLFGGLAQTGVTAGIGGGQLVFAMSPSAGAYPELAMGVTSTFDAKGAYRRIDVPTSLGLIVHLTRATAPLYMALGLDLVYARRSLPGHVPGPTAEEAWLLGGSGGMGIDLPMWQGERSQGRLLIDFRLGGTGRIDGAPALLIPQATGEPQAAIAGQFRALLTLTAQVNLGG